MRRASRGGDYLIIPQVGTGREGVYVSYLIRGNWEDVLYRFRGPCFGVMGAFGCFFLDKGKGHQRKGSIASLDTMTLHEK